MLNYHGPEDWTDIVFGILPSICLIITAAMAVVHFLTRKRGFLIAAMAGILSRCAYSVSTYICIIEKIRFLAFIDYRFRFCFTWLLFMLNMFLSFGISSCWVRSNLLYLLCNRAIPVFQGIDSR